MCLALKYCHDQNVLHGDIKTSNIFLTEAGDLKVGDFGTATNLAKTVKSVNAMTGTPLFFAPEIIHGHAHSFKADVWALGVVCYQLLALQFPFYDTNFASLLTKILEQDAPPLPTAYSEGLRKFVMSLLVKDESQRPEMAEVCASQWFEEALSRFPEEQDKVFHFKPQMRIRITENFLQKEFDAIRVFRFSEDHGSSANSSFRMSSDSNSFVNIFQSNCVGENDPKKTQKMLSRFARMANDNDNDSESSGGLTEESELLDDGDFFKPGRSAKLSTNDTDKGVQIENSSLHAKGWDLGALGVLFHRDSSVHGSEDFKRQAAPTVTKVAQPKPGALPRGVQGKLQSFRADSLGNISKKVTKPVNRYVRHTPMPAVAIGGKNGQQSARSRMGEPQLAPQTSLTEMTPGHQKRSSMAASIGGGMHPAEWFSSLKRQQTQIESKQSSSKNLSSKLLKATSSNSLFPKKYKVLTEKTRPGMKVAAPTALDPALLLQLIDAGSATLRQSASQGPSNDPRLSSLTTDRIEEARRTLIKLVQPEK